MRKMAEQVKAIFFDIDGTLVSFQTHKIPDSAIRALERLREKGIKLCVATGRHKNNLDVLENTFAFDAYITLNGQYACHGETVLHKNPFKKTDILPVIQQVQQGAYPCYFMGEHEVCLSGINDAAAQLFADIGLEIPAQGDPAWALENEIYQMNAFLTKEQEAKYFAEDCPFQLVRWHPNFADVIPARGGKEAGIRAVMAAFGLSGEKTMVFGDGENDISMLRYADIGVAMGNASHAVKTAADIVAGDVDQDGLAEMLHTLGLLDEPGAQP